MKKLIIVIITSIFVIFSAAMAETKRVPIGDVQIPLTASGRPVAVYVDGIGRMTVQDQAMGLKWAEKPIASVKDAPAKFRWKPEHLARVELAPRAWPVGSERGLTTLRLYGVEVYDAETIVSFDADGDGRLSVAEVQAMLFACIWPTEIFGLTGGYTTAMTDEGVVAIVAEISGVKLEIRRVWRQQTVVNGVLVTLAQPEMAWAWGLSADAVKTVRTTPKPNGNGNGSNSGSSSSTTPTPTPTSNTTPAPANTPNPEHDNVILPPKAEAESQGQTSQQSSSAAEPNPQYDNVVKPEKVSSQVEVVSGNATTTSWTVSEAQSQAQPVAVVEAKTASAPTVTFTVQEVQETKSVSASVSEAKASGTETGVTVAPEPRHDSSGLPERVPAE